MKTVLAIVMAMTLAVSVGACQKKDAKGSKKQDRVEQSVKAKDKVSLENLDSRVSDLERSRAAARAAFKRAQSPVKGF